MLYSVELIQRSLFCYFIQLAIIHRTEISVFYPDELSFNLAKRINVQTDYGQIQKEMSFYVDPVELYNVPNVLIVYLTE